MAAVKKQVLKIIEDLPENATIDDIMQALYFKLQVDKGLEQLDKGEHVSHEKVEKRMAKWLTR